MTSLSGREADECITSTGSEWNFCVLMCTNNRKGVDNQLTAGNHWCRGKCSHDVWDVARFYKCSGNFWFFPLFSEKGAPAQKRRTNVPVWSQKSRNVASTSRRSERTTERRHDQLQRQNMEIPAKQMYIRFGHIACAIINVAKRKASKAAEKQEPSGDEGSDWTQSNRCTCSLKL